MDEQELAHELKRRLQRRRYLIVTGDIWKTDAWDDLKMCSTDDNNGSRIIMTTPLNEEFLARLRFKPNNVIGDKANNWNRVADGLSSKRQFVLSRPSGTTMHSLIFHAARCAFRGEAINISFVCHNFKLLKVLDLEYINIGNRFAEEMSSLVHLEFLAARDGMQSIPSLIVNLEKLKTSEISAISAFQNILG
ncbi:putative late blight resistance protein homolog R1B-12 [Capsicum annuum]|uniref:putative late blight resistance protein homolog R1B-12 n=1 Tax=Capsicum annuum TaxID=4072 RepID=UPI001FB089D3|nr:putative late blight resistance protein homolog R1B-12 [Capsicum annuum]